MIIVENKTVLSQDQEKALTAMNEWIYSVKGKRDSSIFFALSGYAGTGKTTLLKTFLDGLVHPYAKYRVCICAPTHKAKKVLTNKTGWKNAETLQALLGLKMDISLDDFDPNKPEFSMLGDRKIKDYDLVVVDEASMINSELYSTIVECAMGTGTKVLFVGDTKQLNPVKEYIISPSLLTPDNKYQLTEIIRQKDTNPLISLLDIIRKDIDDGTNNFMEYLQQKPINMNYDTGEGYLVNNQEDMMANIMETFRREEFKTDKNYCRYIAWTNKSIGSTNKWIRTKVFENKNQIEVGELLLGYRTIASEKKGILLTNSEDYEVVEVTECNEVTYGLDTFKIKLKCVDTESSTVLFLVKEGAENEKKFTEVCDELLTEAYKKRGRAWKSFFAFRDTYISLKDYPYPTQSKLMTKKDIDFGYGITIHKSQGSTYENVFINGKDINLNSNDLERKRLWYVALSRASKKCYILL